MTKRHPQEKIVETFDCNGVAVDVVTWTDTVWCGKIGYAVNNTDEPNVDEIMSGFQVLDMAAVASHRREADWDVCMSVNYFSAERPNGVMFGFLADTAQLPQGFDVYTVSATQYMRVRMGSKIAKALGREKWMGGIPPYEWIGEQIAPMFGYTYGSDSLPVFEYYGEYMPDKQTHRYCYLYVPVEKT